MKFSLLAFFFLVSFGAPSLSLAEDRGACDTSGQYFCTCTVGAIEQEFGQTSADVTTCLTTCESYEGASMWTLSWCNEENRIIDINNGTVGEGESADTVKKDAIIPLLNVEIPGLKFTAPTETEGSVRTNFIAVYINAIFAWLLGAAALIAIVFIMIGGLQYATARGDAGKIGKAKERIGKAVVGVILLLLAYNIAFLIDPGTTRLQALNVKYIEEIPDENIIDYGEGVGAPDEGKYGVGKWQDCMLRTFGETRQEVESQLVPVSCGGSEVKIHKLIQTEFEGACKELATVDYDINSIGTYSWRKSANSDAMSFHSWGVAIDINPSTNPNYPDYPNCPQASCPYDMPPEVVAIFNKYHFKWGGDWRSLKDYMHFSYNGYCGGGR